MMRAIFILLTILFLGCNNRMQYGANEKIVVLDKSRTPPMILAKISGCGTVVFKLTEQKCESCGIYELCNKLNSDSTSMCLILKKNGKRIKETEKFNF